MKRIVTIFIFLLTISTLSYGQADLKYSAKLKEMFILSGSEESYEAVVKQMFSMFKQQSPEVDTKIWDDLEKEFSTTSMDMLVEMLVPVYKKHLTLKDIKGLIRFYKKPLGKKFAKKTPLIMAESMQIGQEWGKKIGEEFFKKLEEKKE